MDVVIRPGPLTVIRTPLPPDWEEHIHSEGKPYFVNRKLRCVTEASLDAPGTAQFVDDCIRQLREHGRKWIEIDKEGVEIYLEPYLEENMARYYFTDWNQRCLFWVDDGISSRDFLSLQYLVSEAQLGKLTTTFQTRVVNSRPR